MTLTFTMLGLLLGALAVGASVALRQQTLLDWRDALSPSSEKRLEVFRSHLRTQASLLRSAVTLAREAESPQQTRAMLDVGLRTLEQTAPDLKTRLRGIAVLSRIVASVARTPPLSAAEFRLPPLAWLMRAGAVAHHLVVAAGRQIRLRVYLLGRGLGVIVRSWRDSADDCDLDKAEDVAHDLEQLHEESATAMRALIVSLANDPISE